MNSLTQFLSDATGMAGQIFNLAPCPFTAVIVIAVGYALRLWKRFDNDYIPAVCMVVGTILFSILNENNTGIAAVKYWTRTISTGFLTGFAAWMLHKVFISQVEEKIPWLGKMLATVDSPPEVTAPAPAGKPASEAANANVGAGVGQ